MQHTLNRIDDARERNILRTVSPVYQFHQASLQDRLATATSEAAQSVGGEQAASNADRAGLES